MFTKKMLKLLRLSRDEQKKVSVYVAGKESFKGTIGEVTPYYVKILKKGGKEKVLTSYRTKWVRKRK